MTVPPSSTSPRRRRRPVWIIALGIVLVAVLALAILFRWDWLIPIVEARASAALGRDVKIAHLHVALGRVTTVSLEGLSVANPPGFVSDRDFAHADRLAVSADVWRYLHDRSVVSLPRIEVDKPDVDARAGADGKPNYLLGASNTASSSGAGPRLDIGDLVINDGRAHVFEPKMKADFGADIRTAESQGDAPAQLLVNAKGTYAGAPIDARFAGGALLTLRDTAHPYPVDLHVANGPTTVDAKGTVLDPLHFRGTNVKVTFAGPNMALLMPLTGIPIPQTPPFHVAGNLDYEPPRIRFTHFDGTLGHSDIGGEVNVTPGADGGRPLVETTLESRRVDLQDLGGFIGSTPGHSDEAGQTAAQRQQVAKAEASSKLLPDTPINIPKFKAADVRLRYHAASIEGRGQPLTDLTVALDLTDGAINVHPVSFGVGKGHIAANVALQPVSDDATHMKADIDFRQVDIAQLMKATPGFTGAGSIGGEGTIDATGRSLAQFLGTGNGGVKLFTQGGDLSALLVALSGLQFGNAVISALGIPNKTQLRCLVVDMPLDRGVLNSRVFVIDTDQSNINVTGNVNLRAETLNMRVETEAKHFSIGSLPTPIDITGPLKSPDIGPATGPLAARAGAAVALGALLTPLGALLPTIQLGLGEDNDCKKMIAEAARQPEGGHARTRTR